MIKAVLFDIDDTILDFEKCSEWAIKTAFAERGLDYRKEYYTAFKEINDALWQRLENGELTRDELFARRFNDVFLYLNMEIDGVEFEKRFKSLLHESTEEEPGARELLKYLYKKGYRIFAVSNALQSQQENRLKIGGLYPYFEGIYTSELLGASKPSTAFFDSFFSRVPDLSKNDVILVGDSLSADISGGKHYGLMTCWYNRTGKNNEHGSFSDFHVDSLEKIKCLL